MDAEDTNCPLCSKPGCPTRWEQTDRLFRTTDRRFGIKICRNCAVHYLAPVPDAEELAGYYPECYHLGSPESAKQGRGLWTRLIETYRRIVLRDHVRFVARVIGEQEGRGEDVFLLDVGCGDGSFLAACKPPRAMGMDMSPYAVRHVKARGFDVVRGWIDEAPLQSGSFSLITMFHVLEHVTDIDATLQTLRRLLRDGGDLVVQVPNVASIQARILGRYWAGLDVPRHLVDFTPRSLRTVLERNGFELRRESHFSIRDNPTTLANSVAPGLYPPGRAARNESRAWADPAYLALTIASVPFAFVESALGRGASITVHARRLS